MSKNELYCFGDIGNYSKTLTKMIEHIKKNNNSIFILLGDNFYFNGVKHKDGPEWNKYIKIFYNTLTYAILGNHDYIYESLSHI